MLQVEESLSVVLDTIWGLGWGAAVGLTLGRGVRLEGEMRLG